MNTRERAAQIIRKAIDSTGECDAEIARRAKLGKTTLSIAIRTGRIRLDTWFRIIEACELEADIRFRSKKPRIHIGKKNKSALFLDANSKRNYK